MPSLSTGGPSPSDPYLALLPDLMKVFTPAELEALIRGRFAIRQEGGFGRLVLDIAKDALHELAVRYTVRP